MAVVMFVINVRDGPGFRYYSYKASFDNVMGSILF